MRPQHLQRGKLSFEKLRGKLPEGVAMDAGNQYLSIWQQPDTLAFRRVPVRDDWIFQLHQQGHKPKEIAEIVSAVYPNTTSNNVSVILTRLKSKNDS